MPFSSQYMTRIVRTSQSKKSTPTSGIRFAATSRTIASGAELAGQRIRANQPPRLIS